MTMMTRRCVCVCVCVCLGLSKRGGEREDMQTFINQNITTHTHTHTPTQKKQDGKDKDKDKDEDICWDDKCYKIISAFQDLAASGNPNGGWDKSVAAKVAYKLKEDTDKFCDCMDAIDPSEIYCHGWGIVST